MKIEREIIERLKTWKNQDNRKPILLEGARQIGKTWVMNTFGNECFEYCARFDFDRQPELLQNPTLLSRNFCEISHF